MIRLVYVTGEPTPYRTPHLEALGQRPEVDLHVVYAARTIQRRTWSIPEQPYVSFLRGPSLPLTRVLHHDYAITPGIWPLLSRLRPDCVVVGGWSLMATQLAIAWCRAHRVPYLLQSDNHLLEPRRAWVRAVKRVVLPALVPQAAGWLVPGSLAREHILRYGAAPERTIVFPLTVDVEEFGRRVDALRGRRAELRTRFEIAPGSVAVLQVARLIPVKAADVLVRAVAAAGRPLSLLLVGEGPESGRLRELAAETGAEVRFAGTLEGEDLASAYAAADVFALVSHRETWGVVVNEAMASGLPLILSDRVGAAADLLDPGRNGELVRAGDVDDLAAAVRRLAADPDRRARFGADSRARIAAWGYEESIGRLIGLLRAVGADD